MPLSNAYANDLLELELWGVAIADIAENDATSPATNLYLSLHTASPAAGNQSTSEISYTGYARVAVARSASGFNITAALADLVATATFGQMTAGAGGTVTHIGLGTGASGSGYLMRYAAVTPMVVGNGSIPRVLDTSTLNFA